LSFDTKMLLEVAAVHRRDVPRPDIISSARASRLSKRHRNLTAAVGLIDEHKLTAISRPQLLIGIEELDSINWPVWGNVHVQLVADADRFDADGLRPQAQVGDVSISVVAKLHSSSLSKIFYQNRDNQPIAAFFDRKSFDLFRTVSFAAPHPIEGEISSETRSTELCRKPFSAFDCCDDLGFACAAFIRPFSSVRMKLNGCDHRSPHTSSKHASTSAPNAFALHLFDHLAGARESIGDTSIVPSALGDLQIDHQLVSGLLLIARRAALGLGSYLPAGWPASMLCTLPGNAAVLVMAGSGTAAGGGTPGSADATGAWFARAATAGFFFTCGFGGGATAAGWSST
jgi:hypothetical protein